MKKEIKNLDLKFEYIIVVIILLLLFSLIGFFIGQLNNESSGMKVSNPEIQKIIEEYNYIVDNYYGEFDKNKLVSGAINGMLSTLDDYSEFLGDDDNLSKILKGSYEGIGISIFKNPKNEFIISSVIDNSPAKKAGIEVDDIILKINDENISKYQTDELVKIISNSDAIKLNILRNKKNKIFEIKKEKIVINSVSNKIYKNNIGYIKVNVFAENTDEQFETILKELELKKIDNLIIDLRNNSGGHLSTVENMISQFLDEKTVIFQTKDKNGIEKYYSKGNKTKNYKIVILQNEFSASASEVMASALNEQLGAYIIGEKSFGKGTVQAVQNVNGVGNYKMTTKKWLTSKGVCIDKKGIMPDLKIKLEEKYYKSPNEKNDNQLQKAISYFSTKKEGEQFES